MSPRAERERKLGVFTTPCPATGKVSYTTKSQAKRDGARVYPGQARRAYECPHCGAYHLTRAVVARAHDRQTMMPKVFHVKQDDKTLTLDAEGYEIDDPRPRDEVRGTSHIPRLRNTYSLGMRGGFECSMCGKVYQPTEHRPLCRCLVAAGYEWGRDVALPEMV